MFALKQRPTFEWPTLDRLGVPLPQLLPTGVNYAARRGAGDSGVGPDGARNTNSEGAQVPTPKNSAQGSPLGRLLGCTSMSPLLLADLFPRPAPGVGRVSEKVAGAQDSELSSHLSTKPLCIRAHSLVPVSKPGPPASPVASEVRTKVCCVPVGECVFVKSRMEAPWKPVGNFWEAEGGSPAITSSSLPTTLSHADPPSLCTAAVPGRTPCLQPQRPLVGVPGSPMWAASVWPGPSDVRGSPEGHRNGWPVPFNWERQAPGDKRVDRKS